nr:meiosis-specific kinetochore protein [Cavia porcellus]
MALWPLRVYPRKRAGRRLNLTPTPDLGPSATAEVAPPRPGPRPLTAPRGLRLGPRDAQGFAGPQGKGKGRGLPQIAEKAEWGGPGSRGAEEPSTQLRDSGEKSLPASNTCEETQNEIAPLSESVTDDLQVDSSSSNSELVSGPGLQSDTSISFLSYSATESSTDYNSIEENLSSFSSPELFRGSNYLDWECPELTEYVQCKNSTLLDTSKAVAIEKAPEFSSLSAILGDAVECLAHLLVRVECLDSGSPAVDHQAE